MKQWSSIEFSKQLEQDIEDLDDDDDDDLEGET